MAENINEKRFFLDWGGVKTLWGKISSTFANKAAVNAEFSAVDAKIAENTANLQTLDKNINVRIDGVEDTIETFMPREFETYTAAVKGSYTLAPGTVVKVLTDSQLLDDSGEPVVGDDGSSPTYKAGLYLIFGSGVLEKISTASGTGSGGNIEEVAAFVEQLDKDAVKGAIVFDENNQQLAEIENVDNNLIIKVDNKFVVDSQSVNTLTHRAIAAMFGELSNNISKIPKFKISVVDQLPEIGVDEISLSTIYLVKSTGSDSSLNTDSNLYIEYIYVEKEVDGQLQYSWEKLGEQSLVLGDFAKKSEVEGMIAEAMQNVVKEDALQSAIDTAKGEILKTVEDTYITKSDAEKFIDITELNTTLGDYYTKGEADNTFITPDMADSKYAKLTDIEDFLTEDEVIVGITTGNIGESIRITDEQINELTTENNE